MKQKITDVHSSCSILLYFISNIYFAYEQALQFCHCFAIKKRFLILSAYFHNGDCLSACEKVTVMVMVALETADGNGT